MAFKVSSSGGDLEGADTNELNYDKELFKNIMA
jgi:hypothetical protein